MSDNYEFKTQPFKHQIEALKLSAKKRNFAYFMEMGCVDGETEFLTQRGWVAFKDFDLEKWQRPLLVAQAVPGKEMLDWGYEFVEPEAYIEKDSDDWYAATVGNGKLYTLMMTGEHTLPVKYDITTNVHKKNVIGVDYMPDATVKYLNQAFTKDPDRVPCYPISGIALHMYHTTPRGLLGFKSDYFEPMDPELNALNEWELRFMVAVMADGTYPNARNNKVDFYFQKERKVERIRYLAAKAGIPIVYETKTRIQNGRDILVHVIHAIAPVRYKMYTEEWYSLPQSKLRIIAEEVFYWDGWVTEDEARFYSAHKEDADFVQYACMSCGNFAHIAFDMKKQLFITKELESTAQDKSVGHPNWRRLHRSNFDLSLRNVAKVETAEKAYCFRVPSGYLILRRQNKIFISGNSGKTKVMIDNIGMLHKDRSITGAIIFAPKGVYRNWSSKEIPTHLPDSIQRDVIVWDAAATDRAKQRMMSRIKNWDSSSRTLQILVFNIESLISEKGKKLVDAFVKRHNGNVFALVDESTCIKNHKAKRTKQAIAVAKDCKVRRIATGSPITNSPLDVFSQCAFLDTNLLGFGSYYSFRNTFANIEKIQNRQGQHYEKILSYKNLDILSDKLDKFSYRVTKKECLDLPDKIYTTRDVELTEEQLKIYKEMQSYAFAILQDGEHFSEMSAQVVLTKFLRLHQILCGSFTSDDGTVHRIKNNRLSALQEVLDETSGKVIIWATYLADIEAITEMLEQVYGPDSFVTYYGATSSDDRVKAIEKFQDENSSVRFFIGNVQTAGRGITLTAANTVVYYSNNFSLELRQQSEDRAHRLGQKNPVTYVDLVVRGSLDEKIIKSLIEKRNIANEILKDDLDEWISISQE